MFTYFSSFLSTTPTHEAQLCNYVSIATRIQNVKGKTTATVHPHLQWHIATELILRSVWQHEVIYTF